MNGSLGHLLGRVVRFPARLYLWVGLLVGGVAIAVAAMVAAYGQRIEEEEAWLLAERMVGDAVARMEQQMAAVEGTIGGCKPAVLRNLQRPDSIMRLVGDWALAATPIVGGKVALEPDCYPDWQEGGMAMVTTTLGNKPVSVHTGVGDGDYRLMEWYRSAREADRGVWTEPYYDDKGGDVLIVSYALPLRDGGDRTVGVMAADVALSGLVDGCSELSPWHTGFSLIIGGGGRLLSQPGCDPSQRTTIYSYADSIGSEELRAFGLAAMGGAGGGRTIIAVEGHEMLVSHSTVPRTGWVVASFTPRDEVDGGRRALTAAIALLLGAALAGSLLAFRHEARRNARRLSALAAEVEAIGAGDAPSAPTLEEAIGHVRQAVADYTAAIRQSAIAQARMQSELDIARAIQRKLMPLTLPTTAGGDDIDVYALLKPVDTPGEDFYDFMLAGGRFHFCIGTVASGASVAASLLMAAARSAFRTSTSSGLDTATTLRALGDIVRDSPDNGVSVSAIVGSLDLAAGTLAYANAGHPSPLLAGPDGTVELLGAPSSRPLGANGREAAPRVYGEETRTLAPGARLLLYTDGVIDATNPGGAAFTDTTLFDVMQLAVVNHPGLSARELVAALDRSVATHMDGEPQHSDQAFMAVVYNPRPPKTADD